MSLVRFFLICMLILPSAFAFSQKNREGKKYIVTLQTGVNFGANTKGASFGYFINKKSILSLEFSALEGRSNDDDFEEEDNGQLYLLSYQFIPSSTFYISPSLYYLNQVKADDFDFNADFEYRPTNKTHYTTLGIGFRIGNQWDWDNFSLACDWAGIFREISVIEEDGPGVDDRYPINISFLNLRLGYSF